ncbi:riboflavin synthase [Companilactobacillus zhachilii]|uniref:riboflavin synthase n=1 Tax=Companilactobacillus zhachilii TaxID=2304606 RepID=UPI001923FF09|nr:riboflavin synthase [Companilactobacillus zhachilii]MBL3530020.1 riboflavin synthase [Companilactobacillus zhachilii]
MFTGIVKGQGKIVQLQDNHGTEQIRIASSSIDPENFAIGESISINGVCLTITKFRNNDFWVDAMPETLKRTTFDELQLNSLVNLEPALQVTERLNGHFLLGHVDTTAVVTKIEEQSSSKVFTFKIDSSQMPFIVEKGSIGIDGVSLTVVAVGSDWFQVALIPYTLKETILGQLKSGEKVNIETDILGKYVVKMNNEVVDYE